MGLVLDHVPFAWHDLDELTTEFESVGLTPEYGGVHDNESTHMSVLGFDDRSYIELLSEYESGEHRFWSEHINLNAGPAAWSIRVDDIVSSCKQALEAGQLVHGPIYGFRERDDGVLVEWDRAEVGTEEKRLLLPFLVQDRTPLSTRVQPSPSVADGPLTGLEQVVCAVRDPNAAVELFRDLYSFPRPIRQSVPQYGYVSSFPGQPLALATPTENGDASEQAWFEDRLDSYRECPCTHLLGTTDMEVARDKYELREPQSWPEGRVAFFDNEALGYRLGVIERS